MIRGINIAINAAHPELPLVEATTFVGSPSSVFVRGVPKSCGNWRITAVSVVVTYPDNTTTTRAAMESAQGVWVATIPGTATSGRTVGGFRILADGEDENGAAITGYVLGFADFAVFSMLPVPAPGETFYFFRYFDAQPATPKKGDAAIIGGVLKYYNGAAWAPFADLSNYKPKQTAVADPTVPSSGTTTATAFIDAITQDANGVITPTKKALPEATTSNKGIVQLDTALTASGKAADAKATGDALEPLQLAALYPEGDVTSAADFTQGIKYDFDTTNRTASVKPFCNTGTAADDNSSLVGRVVIPPFVDAQGNPYITDDGTRYKVVGVSGSLPTDASIRLTAIVAPNTVTTIEAYAFDGCFALASVSLPAATSIGDYAFYCCDSLTSVSLPAATSIGSGAFDSCISLASVSLPSATSIGGSAFRSCTSLASVDFGATPRASVPSLGTGAFSGVPTTCKIIIPDSQYTAWTTASGWSGLVTAGYEFVKHSDWDAPHRYELATKEDKANKTTSLSAQSTDTQYPSAKCVWDALAGKLSTSGGTVTGSITFYEPENGAVVYFPSDGKAKLYFGSGLFNVDDVTRRVTINLRDVATCASPATSGHLAALDASGNPTDSQIPKTDVALKSDLRYTLPVTVTVISTASSEVVSGETVYYGAATLADRTQNQVFVLVALDELRVTIPPAVSGKVRDFGVLVGVGLGEGTALAAPALVPVAPTGETITLMNAEGEMPTLADGTTTESGATVLYFTEVANGTFLVKGEQIQEVA